MKQYVVSIDRTASNIMRGCVEFSDKEDVDVQTEQLYRKMAGKTPLFTLDQLDEEIKALETSGNVYKFITLEIYSVWSKHDRLQILDYSNRQVLKLLKRGKLITTISNK